MYKTQEEFDATYVPVRLHRTHLLHPAAGNFGAVYDGERLADHSAVALKFTQPTDAYVSNEVRVHAKATRARCPAVCPLHAAYTVTSALPELADYYENKHKPELAGMATRVVLVLDLCTGQTLEDVLRAPLPLPGVLPPRPEPPFLEIAPRTRAYNEVDKRDLFRQLAAAAHALHALGIVHRDIKEGNIVLQRVPKPGEKPKLALIDFGLAIDLAAGDARNGRTGPIGSAPYIPAEVYDALGNPGTPGGGRVYAEGAYRPPMDIFALGVVLYKMLFGLRSAPFFTAARVFDDGLRDLRPHYRACAQARRLPPAFLQQGTGDFELARGLSPLVRDVLLQMLHPDPALRITAAALCAHPWLTSSPAAITASIAAGAPPHNPPNLSFFSGRRKWMALVWGRRVVRKWRRLTSAFVNTQPCLASHTVKDMYAAFCRLAVKRQVMAASTGGGGSGGGGGWSSSGGGGGGGGSGTAGGSGEGPAAASGGGGSSAALPAKQLRLMHGLERAGMEAFCLEYGVEASIAARVTDKLFEVLDPDSLGIVRWKHFLSLLPLLCHGSLSSHYPEETLRLFWELWCVQTERGEGTLTESAILELLAHMHPAALTQGGEGEGEGGAAASAQQQDEEYMERLKAVAHSIMLAADANHDGEMSFEEFLGALRSGSAELEPMLATLSSGGAAASPAAALEEHSHVAFAQHAEEHQAHRGDVLLSEGGAYGGGTAPGGAPPSGSVNRLSF